MTRSLIDKDTWTIVRSELESKILITMGNKNGKVGIWLDRSLSQEAKRSQGDEKVEPQEGEFIVQQKPMQENTKMTKNDFELLKTVGKGSFGKVFQVRRDIARILMQVRYKGDGKIYAMKILDKQIVMEQFAGEQDYCVDEINMNIPQQSVVLWESVNILFLFGK